MSQMESVTPQSKRSMVEFIAMIATIISLVALSIDAMLPAFPDIAAELNVSDFRQTQWIITAFIFGMAFGQLFFGAVSDSFGRKFGILSGALVFALGSLIAMFANSMEMLLLGRVIQGFGVSGPRISSIALVRDNYVGDAMARVMSFVMMVFVLVPMLAPTVGKLIMEVSSWHAIFGLFIFLAGIVALWVGIRQQETLTPEKRRPFRLGSVSVTIFKVLKHPRVMGYAVGSGFIFGGLLAYVGSAQLMFETFYGLGDLFPLYFAILSLGMGMSSLANTAMVMKLGARRVAMLALVGLIILSFSLGVISLLSGGIPPFPVFMTLGFFTMFCVGLQFGNLNAMAMVPLGKTAGIGAAVIGFVSNLIGVISSAAIGWFVQDAVTPIPMGYFCCALVTLSLMLLVKNQRDTPVN